MVGCCGGGINKYGVLMCADSLYLTIPDIPRQRRLAFARDRMGMQLGWGGGWLYGLGLREGKAQ